MYRVDMLHDIQCYRLNLSLLKRKRMNEGTVGSDGHPVEGHGATRLALEVERLHGSPAPLTFAGYFALSLPRFPPPFGEA